MTGRSDGKEEIGTLLNEVGRQLNGRCFRHMDLQIPQERVREPLVNQNAAVLWVINEFDDVELAVVCLNEVGLRPAPHLANQSTGAERHNLVAMAQSLEKDSSRKERKVRMAEEDLDVQEKKATNQDEVALELMKFIAVSTGYGKGSGSAGFGGKATRSGEEYAEALLELFDRCRAAVRKQPK